jgi:hypothetical protein
MIHVFRFAPSVSKRSARRPIVLPKSNISLPIFKSWHARIRRCVRR